MSVTDWITALSSLALAVCAVITVQGTWELLYLQGRVTDLERRINDMNQELAVARRDVANLSAAGTNTQTQLRRAERLADFADAVLGPPGSSERG
ncbi:hypothetical protein CPLU01_05237 [Colletotrichum plurivorum]|uniref:Uncharacterized protein n=1 Tax=Colletotrichum plurivorum TaxID=2175906 RepID=A0A8H6NHL9_9PEZI|nr:hypothetical protein CPLU01_05237 [Colletotrichum plurivorum]